MFFILTVNLSFSDWTAKVKSPSSRFTVPVNPEPTTVPVNVEFEVLRPTGVTSVVKNPVSLKLTDQFLICNLPSLTETLLPTLSATCKNCCEN
mgnify:CR=1 FL=1